MKAGVADKVHGCTSRRVLNTAGYHYCRPRKKGLLRAADLIFAKTFAREN